MPDNSFHRDANGLLAFEMFNVPTVSYPAICDDLMASFRLERVGALVSDFVSLAFQDYRRVSQVVGLEWDHWSGFIVVAKTPESEPLVRAIGEWLLRSKWSTIVLNAEQVAAADGGGVTAPPR